MIQETKTASSVLSLCRELDVKVVSLRFTDFLGGDRNVLIPVHELQEESFEYGYGLNSFGLPGLRSDRSTELTLVPIAETSFYDPFAQIPTLNLLCSLRDPITGDDDESHTRAVAEKVSGYLASSGFADRVSIGVDLGFELTPTSDPASQRTRVVSNQPLPGNNATGEEFLYSTWGARRQDIYGELLRQLTACRIQFDAQLLTCSLGHRSIIGVRGDCPVRVADGVTITRYMISRIAERFGMRVSFPSAAGADVEFGTMSINFGFMKSGEPILAGSEYAGLSGLAMGVIGGLLKHGESLCGLTCLSPMSAPSQDDNSNHWLIGYARRNSQAAVRVPVFSSSPKSKRIEFRCCDANCNPYLAVSAIVMAAIEGGQNKFKPGEPLEESASSTMPGLASFSAASLSASLEALRNDHDYLTRGDVFTDALIERWIECQHERKATKKKAGS